MSGMHLQGNAWSAAALSEDEKARHLANAPARADDAAAASRAFRRSGRVLAIAGAIALVASAAASVTTTLTWQPTEPIFVQIDGAGRVTPMIRAVDAPMAFTEGTSRQYLRMYLDTCEMYRYETAILARHRCMLLLSPTQQTAYGEWFSTANSDGFQARFGRVGSASIADKVTYTKQGAQDRIEVWSIRFVRVEYLNQQVVCRPWQSTLTFAFRPDLKMSDEDRTWNLAGMQILNRVSQADPSSPDPQRCF